MRGAGLRGHSCWAVVNPGFVFPSHLLASESNGHAMTESHGQAAELSGLITRYRCWGWAHSISLAEPKMNVEGILPGFMPANHPPTNSFVLTSGQEEGQRRLKVTPAPQPPGTLLVSS